MHLLLLLLLFDPTALLRDAGFVRVESAVEGRELIIRYENRHVRSQAAGLAEVMRLLAPSAITYDSLHIHLRDQARTMAVLHTSGSDLSLLIEGELSFDDWRDRIRYEQTVLAGARGGARRSSADGFTGLELIVGSEVRYQLGNYGGPSDNYRVAFDLQPELRLDLPLGMQARGRLALPLWNNLDANTTVRAEMISLNRGFRTGDGLFGWLSAGLYPKNRAGAQIQLRQFLPDERFSVFMELSHTVYTPITGTPTFPTAAEQAHTTYSGGGAIRIPRYQLDMSARYGQFLYDDQGIRLDLERQFGEGMVGFFVLQTVDGRNGGFRFRVPIPPAKGMAIKKMRIRSARGLEINYRFTGSGLDGRDLESGENLMVNIQQFYPSFLLYELESYIR